MPFAITRRDTGKVVGTTRLWKIDRSNRTLEIGNTWLGQSAQRTSVNTETKFLLLTHAFEVMNMVRVQFMTDELNEKSRAAIFTYRSAGRRDHPARTHHVRCPEAQ